MQDNENYLGKAGAYLQGMDEVGRPSRASEPRLANLVGLAQAEQTGILAGVQARIADAMEEANRLRRVELGLEKSQESAQTSPPDPSLKYVDGGLATVRDSYDPNATELELTSTRAKQDFPL